MMRQQWRSDTDEGSELKLESGHNGLCLLGCDLDGSDALTGGMKGDEGRDRVGWSGGDCGCRGGLLLLRHDLDSDGAITGGDSRNQVDWSDVADGVHGGIEVDDDRKRNVRCVADCGCLWMGRGNGWARVRVWLIPFYKGKMNFSDYSHNP
jgi:hypothetical protein